MGHKLYFRTKLSDRYDFRGHCPTSKSIKTYIFMKRFKMSEHLKFLEAQFERIELIWEKER